MLLLAIFQPVTGVVQLYVVGVPNTTHTNVNKTLVEGWCNAPVGVLQTGAGSQLTPVKTVVIAGEKESIFVCAWIHNATEEDVGLYNFTGRRPPVELGEAIHASFWGVNCQSCYNYTGRPFIDCHCGNHSSGCSHKCICTGGWFGPECQYDPNKRNYCFNNGSYGEIDGKPYCSCHVGWTGDRCQQFVVDTKFDRVQATTPVSSDNCMGGALCVISLLINIFLFAVLGFMLYNRRPQHQQELFLYHSLEKPVPPKPLLVTEI